MFWNTERQYCIWPFEEKTELETSILDAQSELFGDARVYLDVRSLLGTPEAASDAPDAFLIDLSSRYLPVLYLVQIALASHEPLDHVARELLNFDLAGRRAPQRLRTVLRQAILMNSAALDDCESYA